MVTLMLGFAASKALISFWVAWPSVPRPDSANVIVWGPLALGLLVLDLLPLELLPLEQAAAPAARRVPVQAISAGPPSPFLVCLNLGTLPCVFLFIPFTNSACPCPPRPAPARPP